MIHLDTHVVAWLYDAQLERLPRAVQATIEDNDVVISPMVTLELQYLHEIGRLKLAGAEVVEDLAGRIGLRTSAAPFDQVVQHALALTWTRDPFDRIIVATAVADGVGLLTRDATILEHFARARWADTPTRPKGSKRRSAKRARR